MADEALTQDEQRTQEIETAHARMRGHVAEVRRVAQQGAPATSLFPYLDQLEADLNTARPTHAGHVSYPGDQDQTQYGGQGVVTSPTGLSGVRFSEQQAQPTDERAGRDSEERGDDGLTASERDRERAAIEENKRYHGIEDHPAL